MIDEGAGAGDEAAAGFSCRIVAGAVDPAAELDGGVRPRHLLVQERRGGALSDGGRQGLFANGVEVAIQEPRAGAALEATHRAVAA